MGLAEGSRSALEKGIREMQLSHDPAVVDAVFDEANLVSCAGLAPVLALAEQAGLSELLAERLTVPSPNAPVKVTAWSPGWSPGRTRSTTWTCCGTARWTACSPGCGRRRRWARSCGRSRSGTCGSWTRSPPGCSRGLAARTPLLPGADAVAYVDIDDTVREMHGYAKQGAGFGYSGVNGLNALLGVVSTPTAAPVIAAARLRKGATNSARGAARLVTDTLKAAAAAGADPKAGALVIARMDSAFYGHDVIAAVRRGRREVLGDRPDEPGRDQRRSPASTTRAWTAIHYPNAFVDADTGELVSDAEVAEVPVVHRVHLPPQARARHRPADRAPGQAAQPARPSRHGSRKARKSCSRP